MAASKDMRSTRKWGWVVLLPIISGVLIAASLVGAIVWVLLDRDQPTISSAEVEAPAGSRTRTIESDAGTDPTSAVANRALSAVHLGGPGQWAVLHADGLVREWDTLLKAAILGFDAGSDPASIFADRGGRLIVVGDQAGGVEVFDRGGQRVFTLDPPATGGRVLAVGFDASDLTFTTVTDSGLLRTWDRIEAEAGRGLQQVGADIELLQGVAADVAMEGAAFSGDGAVVAVAASDGSVRTWGMVRQVGEVQLGSALATAEGHGAVVALALDGAGTRMAMITRSGDGLVLCLFTGGAPAPSCHQGPWDGAATLALDGGGSAVLVGYDDGALRFFKIALDGQAVVTVEPAETPVLALPD